MQAPAPLLCSSDATLHEKCDTVDITDTSDTADTADTPGARVISSLGGIGMLNCTGASAQHKLHALPDTSPAVMPRARHVWIRVFAHLIAAAKAKAKEATKEKEDACDCEARSIQQARALEARACFVARECSSARGALMLTPDDRTRAEVTTYWSICKRVQSALAENGAFLLATYGDVTLLVDLDSDRLSEGTAIALCKQALDAAAARAKHVLEDGGIKKLVDVGVERCGACRSFDVDVDFKQKRSADEPMTAFIACNACGAKSVKN
jgi:DNA-directed RNA polymerase subunit M/transcription elongation factor TFIIS